MAEGFAHRLLVVSDDEKLAGLLQQAIARRSATIAVRFILICRGDPR